MVQPKPLSDWNAIQSGSLKIEQTRLVYANLPTAIGVNLVLALILAYVQRSVIDHAVLYAWLILMIAVSLCRTILVIFWYRNKESGISSILRWRRRFRIGVIASGLIWGISSMLLFPVGNIPHQAFLSFVLAGLSAGAVTSLSADRLSVLSFLPLILIPLIVRFGMESSEISLSMSVMITLFLIVVSQNASRMRRTLHENIRLRIEAVEREQMIRRGEESLKQLNQYLGQLVAERTNALGASEARFRFLFEQMAVGVAQIDTATGRFMRVNKKYIDITGYTTEEILSLDYQSISVADDLEADLVNMERLKAGEIREFEMEKRLVHKDGRAIWVKLTVSPMWARGARPDCHIAVIQDITVHKQAQEQVHQLAFYDPLTGLPNRRLFLDRLQQAQIHGARHKTHCAILFIDLDYFKTLNDTRGHDVGDLLLIEVAKRLRDSLRTGDTVARLGGDEFVVTVEGLNEDALQAATQARDIGEKILASITQPFRLREYEYHGSSSIGIRLFHDNHASMDDLLKHADTAMYQAKTAGRNTLCFFDPSMQVALEVRTAMATELREAITRRQFNLYYQRQVNAEGAVIGAEVLLRWQHPEWGMIAPMVFIPIAEETGLILPIGKWVLQMACAQLRRWENDPSTCKFRLAVNISARQFRQLDFVDEVLEILTETGADPRKLKLELTESLVLQDIARSIEKMEVLCNVGIRVSLDDFGTGHSSLTYLKRLPLEQIKIDQSFICDIITDASDAVIVRAIIVMCNALGMEVIAEGVETEEQRAFLAKNGCVIYQGYLFGKPMPIEEFQKLIP